MVSRCELGLQLGRPVDQPRDATGEIEFGDGEAVEGEELLHRNPLSRRDRLVAVTVLDDVEDAGSSVSTVTRRIG